MVKTGDIVKCNGCGCDLTYSEQFVGLPCNKYCCGKCCPYAKASPCPKEKKFGGFMDMLQAQNGVKN